MIFCPWAWGCSHPHILLPSASTEPNRYLCIKGETSGEFQDSTMKILNKLCTFPLNVSHGDFCSGSLKKRRVFFAAHSASQSAAVLKKSSAKSLGIQFYFELMEQRNHHYCIECSHHCNICIFRFFGFNYLWIHSMLYSTSFFKGALNMKIEKM